MLSAETTISSSRSNDAGHTDEFSNYSNSASDISTRRRFLQDFVLLGIDDNIDGPKKDFQISLAQLQRVINDIRIFTNLDECVDFLTDIDQDIKAFLILNDTFAEQNMHSIHDIPQLVGIYTDKFQYEKLNKDWVKIKGIHTNTESMCQSIKEVVKQDNQNSIAISFVLPNQKISSHNLNQLEPNFMYTQIFKEILLEMKHEKQDMKNLSDYYRKCYQNNMRMLNIINEFEQTYQRQNSIWWYTRECFIYEILNRALRNLEGDTLVTMGFFINDLHRQIEQLHREQISSYKGEIFLVYRGQGLSTTDFEKLQKTKGGLISFNNVLSTSKKRETPLCFAKSVSINNDTVGILFVMNIDPKISSTPFADLRNESYFNEEEEILFSMHTVFRIGDIKQIEQNNSVYEVHLYLTTDDDEELRTLTEVIRKEAGSGAGWKRLSTILLRTGHYIESEKLMAALFEQASNDDEKVMYYRDMGLLKHKQGKYQTAIWHYGNALKIIQKTLPLNHSLLASSYNNIGEVYRDIGEYLKALSFYEKALEISKNTLSPYDPLLDISYNNIGMVYYNMGKYQEALSCFKKALEIHIKTLPPNHPDLGRSYNNIGAVYDKIGQYPTALQLFKKSLEIRQKTLPQNHPDLANSYSSIGMVYDTIGKYLKALLYCEKAHEIYQNTLATNHPLLALSYNNIGMVYEHMEKYPKAFLFYGKALEIHEKTLPPNHPDLSRSYNNIGAVHHKTENYSEALSFYERSLGIRQKILPQNHPDLAIVNGNIGTVYSDMGLYSKALSFHEKTLEIQQKTLPPNSHDLAISYNNIAGLYDNMGEYSKSLSYLEHARDILQRSLPLDHLDIKNVQMGIEIVKKKI